MTELLAGDIRRFILSLPSVPHLEAILLLRSAPERHWQATSIGERLFIARERAALLLDDLFHAGICASAGQAAHDSPSYFYQPRSDELARLIDRLASYYSRNIIQVTELIHANSQEDKPQKTGRFSELLAWLKGPRQR